MMNKEYENKINTLRLIGSQKLMESPWSIIDYVDAVNELYREYGKEKVNKDLGINQ